MDGWTYFARGPRIREQAVHAAECARGSGRGTPVRGLASAAHGVADGRTRNSDDMNWIYTLHVQACWYGHTEA